MARANLRPTKSSERPGMWIFLALFLFVAFAGFAIAGAFGALRGIDAYWFASVLRGYTIPGLVLGALAVFFVLVTLAYSIKKRSRPNSKSASMMTWLWVHVYGGLLAFALATVHAGPGVISFDLTSGKILWFCFAAVVFTGVLWRIVYASVPPVAGPQVVNYSKAGSARRAVEQETEIEKLCAGKSRELHEAKALLLAAPRSPQEVGSFAQRLPPAEQPLLEELARLAAARHRALARVKLQQKFTSRLQGWRVLHVPVSLAIVVLLVVHVIGALEVPQKTLSAGAITGSDLAVFAPSEACASCHGFIYAQWKDSMHAHALTSPLTVVQNNLDVKISLKDAPSPDPKRICINCHAPVNALQTTSESLPLPGDRSANEGISCVACHSHTVAVGAGAGGFSTQLMAKLEPGRKYYGPFDDAVGNAFHKSEAAPKLFREPDSICRSCHAVNLDRDHDGKIVKGVDLVLQTTYDEYQEYKAAGGPGFCTTCHMPVVPKLTRAADTALIPFQQDSDAPPRAVHDHSFIGVDYPLDTAHLRDPQAPRRAALLAGAAVMAFEGAPFFDGDRLRFKVSLTNQAGHNLPTGFAFARQMWLEVTASSASGATLFSSGKLEKSSSDLCDAATFDDDLKKFMVGCDAVDKDLVNIQLKLMDKIAVQPDAKGQPLKDDRNEFVVVGGTDAKETVLQHPTGGPIARKRPSTKEALVPLHPLEKRTFSYAVPLRGGGRGTLQVRLLFRNLPPYFVRAMGALAPASEPIKVGAMVDHLQVVEMANLKASF